MCLTPFGGFCALTLISLRLPDKAPKKITNKPQITASVVLQLDRSMREFSVCVCECVWRFWGSTSFDLQDVVQPEEPSDM